MSTPAITEDWVPIWPISPPPSQLPAPINGRWLKGGVGGAMTWEVIPGIALDVDSGWHVLGTAGEPGLSNGWANYPQPYGPGRFRKLASGLVVCEGLIYAGAQGATAFTLPVGYRPTPQVGGGYRDHIFQCAMGGIPTGEAMRVDSSGNARPQGAITPGWVDLRNVIFYAG